MENAINKVIKEYKEKIEMEDIRLLNLADEIKGRKAASEDYDDLRGDRIRIRARRQAYVQAAADFDSLLDHV